MSRNPALAAAKPQRPQIKMPALSRNAWLLLTITAANSLALTGVGALLNPYLRNLGMSAAFVGAYFAVAAIVQGVAAFSGGFLADSFGRRRVWLAGKTLQIAAYIWLASGVTGPAVLVAAVLTGASQIAWGAVSAMQADASESAWRATFFAVIQTANSLTAAVAPLAGGMLADAYGARWAFAGVIPLLALVAAMINRLEERPRPLLQEVDSQRAAGQTGDSGRRAALVLGAVKARLQGLTAGILQGPYPRTATLLLGHNMLNGISNGLISITLPMLLRDRLGMGYTGISGIQTALGLGAAMTMIIGARMADKHGRRRVMLISMSSGALLVCTVPLLTTAMSFYLMIFAVGLAANAANGAFSATTMEAVREDSRASYGGVLMGLNAGGMALGNLLGGLGYGVNQMLPMYGVMVLFAVATLLMFFFLEETGAAKGDNQDAGKPAAAAVAGQ